MEAALLFISVCVLGYALVQKRLATTVITGPMVFVVLGLLASSDVFGIIEVSSNDAITGVVSVLFQATLVLVLFTDASALSFSSWRKDAALPGRLLGIGLPLTIGLGTAVAALLFTDLSIWEAGIIGAIIAPTDAALGAAVISNLRVPARIRQALDVESGLNDGVSLPFVLIFMGLATQVSDTGAVETFLREIGVAVVVGVVVGVLGAWLVVQSTKADWIGPAWSGISVFAIAAIAFLAADSGGGSGFIATFTAGLVYGTRTRNRIKPNELVATDLSLGLVQVSFLMFGALVLTLGLTDITWQVVVMAVFALTVARMLPVAIAMIGTRLKLPTILYIGWFGPRGLATIVFAGLVVTSSDLPGISTITTVAAITVGLSVFAHGLTSYVGSQKYADWYEAQEHEGLKEAKPVNNRLRPRFRREESATAARPEPGTESK
jgi:NhaP-type Na+/H+ or K+/H+ antiporter